METAKDIFFFVGSILGIAGFISSVIQPFLNDNREKWSQITEIFDDNFFRGLETVYTRRSVSQAQFNKLWLFLDKVRENKDHLRLKFPCEKSFSKHRSNLVDLIKKFDNEVKPPIWKNIRTSGGKKRYNGDYQLSKSYFREKYQDHVAEREKYKEHLNYATDLAIKMRIEFRAMKTIANLRVYELPFRKKLTQEATKELRKV